MKRMLLHALVVATMALPAASRADGLEEGDVVAQWTCGAQSGPPRTDDGARRSSSWPARRKLHAMARPIDHARLDRIVADARKAALERGQGYREQALKLYPWVCGRCGRAFTRANLSELTVHHR